MTLLSKSLIELQEEVVQWARDLQLFEKASPEGQMRKTFEEIEEAKVALQHLGEARYTRSVTNEETNAALELGDVLVTLCIQAKMQGTTLKDCIEIGTIPEAITTWDKVDPYATVLSALLSCNAPTFWHGRMKAIGFIYLCVQDAAYTQLSKTCEECLQMALEKIRDRTGRVVDGVFVKD